jgi:hypothetical protein
MLCFSVCTPRWQFFLVAYSSHRSVVGRPHPEAEDKTFRVILKSDSYVGYVHSFPFRLIL